MGIKVVLKRKAHRVQRGFTLVELLLTMAILSIIVVPVLSVILTSSRNNSKAKEQLYAATLSEKVMEEIKTHSKEMLATNPIGVFYEDESIIVDYVVELLDSDEVPNGSFGIVPERVLIIEIGDDSFNLVDSSGEVSSYNLSSTYAFEISGTASPYNLMLYEQNTSKLLLKKLTIASVDGSIGIYLVEKANRTSTSSEGVFHITVGDNVPTEEEVNFFISEKLKGISLINDGLRPINKFYYIEMGNKGYNSFLYKITVVARQKNKEKNELQRLVSYLVR